MKEVLLIGKQSGVYEGHSYYQLFFTEFIDEKKGEGSKPYVRQNGISPNGQPKFSHAIGCTETVYNSLVVGEIINADYFLFNAKGKLSAIAD